MRIALTSLFCTSMIFGGKTVTFLFRLNLEFSAQEQGLRLSGSFKCLNSKVDLSTLEAEATLDLWEHQLQRLRNEGSVRTITRELHMAQSVPAVRIRSFKNGEGSRGQGEILIGSSIHAVCMIVNS